MFLSELGFTSLLSYPPRGMSREHEHARDLRTALKRDSVLGKPPRTMTTWVAQHLAARLADSPFAPVFGPDVCLVPVPGSRQLGRADLWVPMNLANALRAACLGAVVLPLLRRTKSVAKSATSTAEHRPLPIEHDDSLQVDARLLPAARIVLVDDIVTRGATLLGAASRLAESYPSTPIVGFAAMRAISDARDFRSVVDPVRGTITLRPQGDTLRRP